MKNWQSRFQDVILSRGLDYYNSNAVRIIDYSPEHVIAEVAGSRVYDVSVYFENSDIHSMYCDCPYFEGYGNCKHLAATLYHIDDHPELIEKKDYTKFLLEFSKDELIEFLNEEIPNYPYLEIKLKLFKNENPDDEYYITKLKNSMDSSFDILKFLNIEIQDLIKTEQFDLMFRLLVMIMDRIAKELQWGYFQALDDVIDKIDDVISQIRDKADINDISDFLEYAINLTDNFTIMEGLTDCMSRNGDMSRLLCDDFF